MEPPSSLVFLLSSNLRHPNTPVLLFPLHCCSVQKYLGTDKRLFLFCFVCFFCFFSRHRSCRDAIKVRTCGFVLRHSELGQTPSRSITNAPFSADCRFPVSVLYLLSWVESVSLTWKGLKPRGSISISVGDPAPPAHQYLQSDRCHGHLKPTGGLLSAPFVWLQRSEQNGRNR